jgi:hypothetical protein
MMKYLPLLLQLRIIADEEGDKRSLVAIAAKFERTAGPAMRKLSRSLKKKGFNRNEPRR